MDLDAQGFVDGLKGCFADLKDPRNENSCAHRLFDIVAIAVLSVACGADDWCDMATFARVKLDWLKTFLALPGGAPSHDTFRRVFGLLDRNQFAAHLFRWTQALHEATGGKLIAIDGKTLRRTFSTGSGLRALHLVTAWASENGLTLGQVACEEKSNEITAIPELLKLLDLKGCTGDDRRDGLPDGDRRGDPRPEGALSARGEGQPADVACRPPAGLRGWAGQRLRRRRSRHARHAWRPLTGAHTERTYDAIAIPRDHPQRKRWRDLRTLVLATSCVTVGAKETWETRMFISDLRPRAKSLGACRSQALGHRERSALGARCELPRGRRSPAGPPWLGEPGRRSSPDRQPAPPGEDVEARRESEAHGLRTRCQLSPQGVGHR